MNTFISIIRDAVLFESVLWAHVIVFEHRGEDSGLGGKTFLDPPIFAVADRRAGRRLGGRSTGGIAGVAGASAVFAALEAASANGLDAGERERFAGVDVVADLLVRGVQARVGLH